ncbi:hypothetical protein PtB15_5B377 [Puccinia triticina]|nr:hypothetical protein PtB15_5B377 [Puccinia triticina]
MARRNRPHGSVNTINTGTSHRRRTAQGQLRDVSREREEQADRNESLNIAERLGHITPLRRRHWTEPLQHLPDPDQAYPAHEPLIGSYLDEQLDPSIEEELPTAAHAAYHRARRYAETRERISQRWSQLEISLTATFTLCQTITSNWTSQASKYELPPNTCTCNPDDIRTRKVDVVDLLFRHSADEVPFCKCIPDIVRLIHYGYIASSPEQPRTAFSIRLLQFHHKLWQSSALSTTSFVKALSLFLDNRNADKCYARGKKYQKRNLRVPFTCSVDLYSRIQINQKKILSDGMQLTQREKWAIKCPRCFGPQECEIKGHPDEPDVIIAMDGNFQQRHYAYASKDNPPESKYPSSFIPPSGIALDATQFSATKGAAVGIDLNEMAAYWLLHKLESANQIHEESALALAELHCVANPHTPGSNYTNQFFEQQWNNEQAYHVNTNQTADREQVELGRLLCLEEELNEAWSAVAITPEQALTRARTCATVARQLEAQRRTARQTEENSDLSRESTTLGTCGQQRLTEALRKRASKLRTKLNNYNRLARAFIQITPNRPAPPIIEYTALLSLQSDDIFWNDGIFTNANEPWAVDRLTQQGIRAFARFNRALEEKR